MATMDMEMEVPCDCDGPNFDLIPDPSEAIELESTADRHDDAVDDHDRVDEHDAIDDHDASNVASFGPLGPSNRYVKMGFQVVDRSAFAFATDLPPSSRRIHPSGVLHAFRIGPTIVGQRSNREEHAFAWIADCAHVESALDRLEAYGFHSDGIVFIPYSTKRNWIDRYPHAEPAMECDEEGKVTVYWNYRPYPNGLGDLEGGRGRGGGGGGGPTSPGMAQANNVLTDAERDELHVEMFKYLCWLHGRLVAADEKAAAKAATRDAARRAGVEGADDGADETAAASADAEEAQAVGNKRKRPREDHHNFADTSGLMNVLDMMRAAFPILPFASRNLAPWKKSGGKPSGGRRLGKTQFLEGALKSALTSRVEARKAEGRRKRRRAEPLRKYANFDEMFERLVRYKAEHGDCRVPRAYVMDGKQLGDWVLRLRERMAFNIEQGAGTDKPTSGGKLTAERIARLNALEFHWELDRAAREVTPARLSKIAKYYDCKGRWPDETGKLGELVTKHRIKCSWTELRHVKHQAKGTSTDKTKHNASTQQPQENKEPRDSFVGTVHQQSMGAKRHWMVTVGLVADPSDAHRGNKIVLPIPADQEGFRYTRQEAVEILSRTEKGKRARTSLMKDMIKLGYAPTTTRTLQRLLQLKEEGKPIDRGPWPVQKTNADANRRKCANADATHPRKCRSIRSSVLTKYGPCNAEYCDDAGWFRDANGDWRSKQCNDEAVDRNFRCVKCRIAFSNINRSRHPGLFRHEPMSSQTGQLNADSTLSAGVGRVEEQRKPESASERAKRSDVSDEKEATDTTQKSAPVTVQKISASSKRGRRSYASDKKPATGITLTGAPATVQNISPSSLDTKKKSTAFDCHKFWSPTEGRWIELKINRGDAAKVQEEKTE